MNETKGNYLTSVIRTVIPTLWGTVLAWFVSVGVLDQAAADGPGQAVGGFLVTIAVGVYYIAARWIETQQWAPPWLVGILLGRPAAPVYAGRAPAGDSSPRIAAADPYVGEHRAGDGGPAR